MPRCYCRKCNFESPPLPGLAAFHSYKIVWYLAGTKSRKEEATSLSSEVEARDKQAFAENLPCVKFIKAAKAKTQITGKDFMLKQVLNDVLKSRKILSLYYISRICFSERRLYNHKRCLQYLKDCPHDENLFEEISVSEPD